MGTALGDALARKGLVGQKRADDEAAKIRKEKERKQAEAEEAERRSLEESGKADGAPTPEEWLRR